MKKPSKKTLLSTLYALLIGVLGCAIWEYAVSPLCTFIYIKISSLIDKFTVTFSNNTYSKISEGYNCSSIDDIIISIMLILLIFSCFFFSMYNLHQNNKKIQDYIENNHTLENISKIIKKELVLNITSILTVNILIIIFMYWTGNNTFINQCKTSCLCNLEIICPYISDLEYKELKSSFYSIKTKEDYEKFTITITEIGEKYHLNLKE